MSERPSDIKLPEGWTWQRVEEERAKWGISEDMVPIARVPGAAVAWGTIHSVRMERSGGKRAAILRSSKAQSHRRTVSLAPVNLPE